jgi:hypothetical protein
MFLLLIGEWFACWFGNSTDGDDWEPPLYG